MRVCVCGRLYVSGKVGDLKGPAGASSRRMKSAKSHSPIGHSHSGDPSKVGSECNSPYCRRTTLSWDFSASPLEGEEEYGLATRKKRAANFATSKCRLWTGRNLIRHGLPVLRRHNNNVCYGNPMASERSSKAHMETSILRDVHCP